MYHFFSPSINGTLHHIWTESCVIQSSVHSIPSQVHPARVIPTLRTIILSFPAQSSFHTVVSHSDPSASHRTCFILIATCGWTDQWSANFKQAEDLCGWIKGPPGISLILDITFDNQGLIPIRGSLGCLAHLTPDKWIWPNERKETWALSSFKIKLI